MENRNCPCCKSKDFSRHKTNTKNLGIEQQWNGWLRCNNCWCMWNESRRKGE